jgi:hypothetical protein
MAARLNKLHSEEVRFYVYDILDALGNVIYVGKGSGYRAKVSCAARGGKSFSIVDRFTKEAEAYSFEVSRIAELKPLLNIAKGGNGSKATKTRTAKDKWQKTFELTGSRAYAARLWLAFARPDNADLSKVDAIRAVAYG